MTKTLEEKRAHEAKRQRDWRHKNAEKYNAYQQKRRDDDPDRHNDYMRKWRRENPASVLVHDARLRAKKKSLVFDLDDHLSQVQERLDIGVCEMSGLPFEKGIMRSGPFSASIDRIEPKLGYAYSNIRIICFALNRAFSDWGEETLFRIVDAVRAKMKEAPLSTA